MKSAEPRRKSRAQQQSAQDGGVYTRALTAEERALLAAGPRSLADEQLLLRAQIYRLARRIDLEDAAAGLKQLRVLAELVRTVAALERIRLADRGRDAAPGRSLAEAVAALSPFKRL